MNPAGFDILYEQGPCLIVAKPSGVLTQAPPGIDSLEVRIKQFLKQRDDKPGRVYLAVVHRIDRPVSGVMVFAKHVRAARRLSEQFEGRLAEKTYWALVEGRVEPDEGTWTDHLRKIDGEARSETVPPDHPEGRSAVLHYRVLERRDNWSWLEIELETGRTHQIRVQTASRGHPVLGDELYGSQTPFGPPTDDQRLRPIALHARSLKVRHPMTQELVTATAPLPEPWRAMGLYD
jgi:23S rRNA pseudouridine1911/1915/1917 synthase